MTAPKIKSETDRARVKEYIARLDRQGWSQWQIRDEMTLPPPVGLGLDISQPMVGVYLKQIRLGYEAETRRHRQEMVQEKVAQLKDIRREAWRAYERSHHDAEKLVEEWGVEREAVGEGDYVSSEVMIKRITTKEGRLPDNAYLSTVLRTLEAERELLGLDEKRDGVVTIEQCMTIIGAIRDAARDVLSNHPDLLRALMQRTVTLVPVIEMEEKVK